MKIQYASDLHLEFGSDPLRPEDMAGDVLVLAGDLHGKPARLAQWLAALPPRPILLVLGNHEHYGGHFIQTLDKYRQALADLPHVQLLEQEEIHRAGAFPRDQSLERPARPQRQDVARHPDRQHGFQNDPG